MANKIVAPELRAVLSATTFCTFLREFSPLEVCGGRTRQLAAARNPRPVVAEMTLNQKRRSVTI